VDVRESEEGDFALKKSAAGLDPLKQSGDDTVDERNEHGEGDSIIPM
jgi:hypothetical protein